MCAMLSLVCLLFLSVEASGATTEPQWIADSIRMILQYQFVAICSNNVSGIRRLRATPQARARLARAAVVPPASVWASSRTGTAGHCARQQLRRPACVARGDFLEIGHFATFSQFLHIKGRNFLDVFMFTSAYNPYKP